MVAGGNIWLNPHSANHSNMKKKKRTRIWKNTDAKLQPDLFSFLHLNSRNFMNGKCLGDRFSKAAMACVSWVYHVVLVSSCCLEQQSGAPPEELDPCTPSPPNPPTPPLHRAALLLTGKRIHTTSCNLRDVDIKASWPLGGRHLRDPRLIKENTRCD